MMTRSKNCLSLQDIVRFGVMLLMAINVLVPAEGVKTRDDYSIIVDSTGSKQREIRGYKKPPQMSPAYGYGKRSSIAFQPVKLYRHGTMMPSKDVPQGFPIEPLVQFLKMNPKIARKVERSLLPSNEEDFRPWVTQQNKKPNSEDTYYIDDE